MVCMEMCRWGLVSTLRFQAPSGSAGGVLDMAGKGPTRAQPRRCQHGLRRQGTHRPVPPEPQRPALRSTSPATSPAVVGAGWLEPERGEHAAVIRCGVQPTVDREAVGARAGVRAKAWAAPVMWLRQWLRRLRRQRQRR